MGECQNARNEEVHLLVDRELGDAVQFLKNKHASPSDGIAYGQRLLGFWGKVKFPYDFSDTWKEKEMISPATQSVLTVAFTVGEGGRSNCSF